MKKCHSLLRWPCWPQDVLNRRLLFVGSRRLVAPRKPSPIFSSFLELSQKTVDTAKICGGAENVVKTETQQTFVNGLLGFITLGIYTPTGSVCITHNNCMSCPSCKRSIYCSLIYFWVPSSCFCIVISHSLWGWNNPVQRCLPVGEAALSAQAAGGCTDWQTALMCNRRRPAATHHHAEHHFQL